MLKSRAGHHGLFVAVGTSKGYFMPPLAFMLNQMDFPSDTPVLPRSCKGTQWGLTLSQNDTGAFEVSEMLPTSVLASSRESLPMYRSWGILPGQGIAREIGLVWGLLQKRPEHNSNNSPYLPLLSQDTSLFHLSFMSTPLQPPVDAMLLKSSVGGGQQADLLGNRLLASLCCFENIF